MMLRMNKRSWRPLSGHRDCFAMMLLIAWLAPLVLLTGCEEGPATDKTAEHARRAAQEDSTTLKMTPDELRRRLKTNEMATFLVSGNDIVEVNLFRSGVRSIEPLKGLPLRGVDLGLTSVSDSVAIGRDEAGDTDPGECAGKRYQRSQRYAPESAQDAEDEGDGLFRVAGDAFGAAQSVEPSVQ
jgi:hypothetical protein